MNDEGSEQQNLSANIDEGLSKHEEADNEDEDEDEEEEDVDFNPFLKGTPSPEASSSLSSEVEALDGNLSKPFGEVRNYNVGDSEHGEEVVMQALVPHENDKQAQNDVRRTSKKRKIHSGSPFEEENAREKDNSSGNLVVNVDDNEDAICKRTRARYSLASFTLDELETFLQETDDEDDLPHVDDEQEYRKFLAAVLQGGDGDGQSNEENQNGDEEDEDNDADFEIELEELLESDVDDNPRDKELTMEYERAGRRPETRQNRRQKASAQYKKKLLEQTKRPLRPLLPILPNGAVPSILTNNRNTLMPATVANYSSSTSEEDLINGFTLQQIGQLHCLIHEHMQLLIQVYSLCILDPSRQNIASQLQGLIFEMLHKRDDVIASRSMPYLDICFRPPFVCPSVSDELSNHPNFQPLQCVHGSSPAPNMQKSDSQNNSPSKRKQGDALHREMGSSQTTSCFWVPRISGPVMSILDVAPLNLVRRYMDDVCDAVRQYRQHHLDSSCDTRYEKEPLFHLPCIPSLSEANSTVLIGNTPPAINNVPSTPGQQPKKTLAASIVESVKKQSVALVPKDVSKSAQRFFSLFNPALFPHKPPPMAVANRVLFTDAEDELLALGIMEYNTDWKAIQHRFLPCKSTHQIFVRQKNRCSSKAPENPIKAVRRMKTSPLCAQEIERIQEGLRVFKLDWMSVWKFYVPHRDPSLLPRQWRIALGTQRSYKQDAAKKEKRRIYEAKRRRCKTEHSVSWQLVSNEEDNQASGPSGGHLVDSNANEVYVHHAFLADWRPGDSSLISSEQPSLNLREKDLPTDTMSKDAYIGEQPNDYILGTNSLNKFPYELHYYQHPHVTSSSSTMKLSRQTSDMILNPLKSTQIFMWPCQARRIDGAHLVKLAPELPPVNLPPSVRIISESAFKHTQSGASVKVSARGGDTGDSRKREIIPQIPQFANLSTTNSAKTRRDKSNQVMDHATTSRREESAIVHDAHVERGTDSDLQMHPLLFQAPEDGHLPYYPLNCGTGTSGSFSFFSGNQPQLNLSLFHNPHQANHMVDCLAKSSKESTSASCGINFHPLLQRTDEENSDLVIACPNTDPVTCCRGKSAHFQSPSDIVRIRPPFAAGPKASSFKASELDLEIHLSSTSAKDKTRGNKDVDTNNHINSQARAKETHDTDRLYYQHSENCPTVLSNSVSDADASAVPGNDASICNMDNIGDQSHHEIVMEQEELSDSDEEMEEHVEFECEEMADSDGEEGSGCEAIPEVQQQEASSFAKETGIIAADHGDQRCESRSPVLAQGTSSDPQICTPPFLNLCLTNLGKDATSSSWLSLDSCAPVDPPRVEAKHEEVIAGESPAKSFTSCRPSRSCKKVMQSMKGVATQKNVMDMAQQLSLGPLAVSTLRRPRKRACRMNTRMGMTKENSRHDEDKSS